MSLVRFQLGAPKINRHKAFSLMPIFLCHYFLMLVNFKLCCLNCNNAIIRLNRVFVKGSYIKVYPYEFLQLDSRKAF